MTQAFIMPLSTLSRRGQDMKQAKKAKRILYAMRLTPEEFDRLERLRDMASQKIGARLHKKQIIDQLVIQELAKREAEQARSA